MGIKAAYSPKQSIWDGGLEGDGHGHSSWQHPTLDGTRLRVQLYPCFSAAVAPIGCQRLHQRGSPELLHVLGALLEGWKSFQDVTKISRVRIDWTAAMYI